PLPLEKPVSKTEAEGPPPPNLEDYWLVRDSSGRVGWVRARTIDEDVPDVIAGLAEGQKIVGAYVLRKVNDPGASVPGGQVPEYVAFLAPWKDGLPYDFDQVRVYTWNTKKHRYETAYRERNIEGFLPVSVTEASAANQQTPKFSFRVATGDAVALDPQTGMVNPVNTTTESFHMEGVVVRRDGAAPPPRPAAARAGAGHRAGHHVRRHR
ncbi:MAG: SH3 domain-containing protein, partial [Acidobacteriota bacterium]